MAVPAIFQAGKLLPQLSVEDGQDRMTHPTIAVDAAEGASAGAKIAYIPVIARRCLQQQDHKHRPLCLPVACSGILAAAPLVVTTSAILAGQPINLMGTQQPSPAPPSVAQRSTAQPSPQQNQTHPTRLACTRARSPRRATSSSSALMVGVGREPAQQESKQGAGQGCCVQAPWPSAPSGVPKSTLCPKHGGAPVTLTCPTSRQQRRACAQPPGTQGPPPCLIMTRQGPIQAYLLLHARRSIRQARQLHSGLALEALEGRG